MSSDIIHLSLVSLRLQDFVFGDFSEQEAEKLFDNDKQGVRVNMTAKKKTIFVQL